MFTGVTVQNQFGGSLDLSPYQSNQGVYVADITGLEPVKADISTGTYPRTDGNYYQSSRREMRNIVITLGFTFDFQGGPHAARRNLYNYFQTDTDVVMVFHNEDLGDLQLAGRVESFESPRFTEEPTATISILCFEPDFLNTTRKTVVYSGTAGLVEKTIEYAGDVPTPLLTRLRRSSWSGSVPLTLSNAAGTFSQEFDRALFAGATVQVDNDLNNLSVRVEIGQQNYPMLQALRRGAQWMYLYPGTNQISLVYPDTQTVNLQFDWYERFGGV